VNVSTFGSIPTLVALCVVLTSCASAQPTIATVDRVDIERFMGDWYVIASIPTRFERGAHNAVETYRLAPNGTIRTTFSYRKGSFDGKLKTSTPRGFIRDTDTNAVWGMQFVWPFKAEYLIIYLDEDYTTTMIGRSKRDYLWIMARAPEIPDEEYQRLVEFAAEVGYDVKSIQKVPQRWDEPPDDGERTP
jgi:apolipoprotein D and lipocalin family protein